MPSVPYHNHDLRYYRRPEVDERLRQRPSLPLTLETRQEIATGTSAVADTLTIEDGAELTIADGASVVLVG